MLVYFSLILRQAPFGDEAWDWGMVDRSIYIAAGRPGLALYLNVFEGHGVPYAYGVAAALFFAILVSLQLSLLGCRSRVLKWAFVAVQLGIIQFSYAMIDCFLADAVMLGELCATAAYVLASRQGTGWCRLAGAAVLVAAAASVYQLIVLLIPVLFMVHVFLNRKNSTPLRDLRLGVKVAAVGLAGILLYQVVQAACKMNVSSEAIECVQSYQNTLVTWGQLDLKTHILHIGKQWCMHLIGMGYAGEYLYASCIIPVALLVVLEMRDRTRKLPHRLWYAVMPPAMYLLPFLPIAALGEDQGARLFMAEPLAAACLWILLIRKLEWDLKKVAGCIVYSVSGLVMLKACYMVSDIAFFQHRIFIQNQTAHGMLKQRIAQVEDKAGLETGTTPVILCGQWKSELRKQDRFNSCIINISDFFFYTHAGDWQIIPSGKSTIPADKLERLRADMPAWPAPGSVRYADGYIIVKF